MNNCGKKIKAKYKGYCYECHYTLWQGEWIWYTGKARHLDCVAALKDGSPRNLNPEYIKNVGKKPNKKRVVQNKEKEVVLPNQCRLCKKYFLGREDKYKIDDGVFVHHKCKNKFIKKQPKIRQEEKIYANYTYLKPGQRRRSK